MGSTALRQRKGLPVPAESVRRDWRELLTRRPLASLSSDESGRAEVYAAPFPGPGPKWQVSTAGASQQQTLRWRGDGKELFYVAAGAQLMAVPVKAGIGPFETGAPVPLFRLDSEYPNGYDVTADGQRFLVSSFGETRCRSPLF